MTQTQDISMMERLQLLPLFQGMAESDMNWVVEKLRFDFQKLPEGRYIVMQDDFCDNLIFLLNGEVCMETQNPSETYRFLEKLMVPCVLQPEVLFGPRTRYTHSFRTTAETHLLKVNKQEFWAFLIDNEVFRLNFINMLSAKAQNAEKALWKPAGGTLEQRLIRFLLQLCTKPTGEKILKIKMEDLAWELNETRLNVSKTLNKLQKQELVCLKRQAIEIPQMEKLYQLL